MSKYLVKSLKNKDFSLNLGQQLIGELIYPKYTLSDANNNELVVLDSKFSWRKFRFIYTVITSPRFEELKQKELLLFTVIHSVNFNRSMVAASV